MSSMHSFDTVPRFTAIRFKLRKSALKRRYNGVAEEKFGAVTIVLPDDSTYEVADLRYPQDGRRRNMRLLPVSDDGSLGSQLVDDALRAQMGLARHDLIFALASYI